MVIGGIQGDEPGGFSAASLLVTGYTITKGQVWVVPNLNFPSIIERSRGRAGDMNRKFAHIEEKDPDYRTVKRIQEIILDPAVDLVLNLHDGSGFYRPTHINAIMNPKRWGQCVIIDQQAMNAPAFGNLAEMAQTAADEANKRLLHADHRYHLRNTKTSEGDKEMEKSLSYFAVRNGKPAFGVEASKNFTTEFRGYYHLAILESFMTQMGIAFERHFPHTPKGVQYAINNGMGLSLCGNRVILPLDNIRPTLSYVPLRKNAALEPAGTSPLLAVVDDGKGRWKVAYGNRVLTRLSPEYLDFDESLKELDMVVDGKTVTVALGSTVTASASFMVKGRPGYRVNAIGARKEKKDGSECDVVLRRNDFTPRFSVDKNGALYRVEVYKGKAFAGMILVRFGAPAPSARETMTAVKGPESSLGF